MVSLGPGQNQKGLCFPEKACVFVTFSIGVRWTGHLWAPAVCCYWWVIRRRGIESAGQLRGLWACQKKAIDSWGGRRVFAYLPFGCIGLPLLNQRKMAFSSVITDRPEDSESSNSEFSGNFSCKGWAFFQNQGEDDAILFICGGKCLLLSAHLCEELTFATVSDRSCSFEVEVDAGFWLSLKSISLFLSLLIWSLVMAWELLVVACEI